MCINIKIGNISITLKAKMAAVKIMVILIMKESVKMINMITNIRMTITRTKKTTATKIMAATQLLKLLSKHKRQKRWKHLF